MKMSRLDFFKLVGGGSALAGAALSASGGGAVPASIPESETLVPSLGPERDVIVDSRSALKIWASQICDVVPWTMYDRFHLFAAGELPISVELFKIPLGYPCAQCGEIKGLEHTNMWQGNMLPMPREFWIQRIFFLLDPDASLEDARLVARAYSWRFTIGQKGYAGDRPLVFNRPAPGTVSTLVRKDGRPRRLVPAEVQQSAEQFGVSGGLLLTKGAYFALRLELGNGFSGVQLSPDGTAGVSLLIAFDGLMKRAIQ